MLLLDLHVLYAHQLELFYLSFSLNLGDAGGLAVRHWTWDLGVFVAKKYNLVEIEDVLWLGDRRPGGK